MKKTVLILFLSISLVSFSQSKKILIVATNIDSVGNNKSGTYLMEIAYPFNHFVNKGYDVDIVTPRGGKTSIYDNGKVAADLDSIRNTPLFIKKTGSSLSPDQVKTSDYIAVFYPGGHGQYFDVMNDERIAVITAKIAEKQFMNISNYGKLLPFDMQEVLARRGASLVVCTPETRPNKDFTHIIDSKNRMVTGAFAGSAQWVAEEVLKLVKP